MEGPQLERSFTVELCEQYAMENAEEVSESASQQNASALLHLLPIVTRRVGDVASQLSSLTTLLGEIPSALKRNAALPSLAPLTLQFVASVLQQINDGHPQSELFRAALPDLLKTTSALLTSKTAQTMALDSLYDVIIQGDCLKGNWKPIVSSLKVGATTHSDP